MAVIRRGAIVGLAALLLASCKPIVHAEMFGCRRRPQGAPEIRLAGCPPYAYSVFLTPAWELDHVLWRVTPMKNRQPILPKSS